MTKLSNGVEYNNAHLKSEFAEYLLQNHFHIQVTKDHILFTNARVRVFFRGWSIDVFFKNDISGDWDYKSGYVGIELFDVHAFILLMHVMNVQNIRGFVANAQAIDEQHGNEARYIHYSLLSTLKTPTYENESSIPAGAECSVPQDRSAVCAGDRQAQ